MNNPTYLLEVYDADGFTGPNPLHVTGMGIIKGPENTSYYIIEPDQLIDANEHSYKHLALRAHYNGDSIAKIKDSVCTVGIALFNNGEVFLPDKTYSYEDLIHWKVGKLHPQTPE